MYTVEISLGNYGFNQIWSLLPFEDFKGLLDQLQYTEVNASWLSQNEIRLQYKENPAGLFIRYKGDYYQISGTEDLVERGEYHEFKCSLDKIRKETKNLYTTNTIKNTEMVFDVKQNFKPLRTQIVDYYLRDIPTEMRGQKLNKGFNEIGALGSICFEYSSGFKGIEEADDDGIKRCYVPIIKPNSTGRTFYKATVGDEYFAINKILQLMIAPELENIKVLPFWPTNDLTMGGASYSTTNAAGIDIVVQGTLGSIEKIRDAFWSYSTRGYYGTDECYLNNFINEKSMAKGGTRLSFYCNGLHENKTYFKSEVFTADVLRWHYKDGDSYLKGKHVDIKLNSTNVDYSTNQLEVNKDFIESQNKIDDSIRMSNNIQQGVGMVGGAMYGFVNGGKIGAINSIMQIGSGIFNMASQEKTIKMQRELDNRISKAKGVDVSNGTATILDTAIFYAIIEDNIIEAGEAGLIAQSDYDFANVSSAIKDFKPENLGLDEEGLQGYFTFSSEDGDESLTIGLKMKPSVHGKPLPPIIQVVKFINVNGELDSVVTIDNGDGTASIARVPDFDDGEMWYHFSQTEGTFYDSSDIRNLRFPNNIFWGYYDSQGNFVQSEGLGFRRVERFTKLELYGPEDEGGVLLYESDLLNYPQTLFVPSSMAFGYYDSDSVKYRWEPSPLPNGDPFEFIGNEGVNVVRLIKEYDSVIARGYTKAFRMQNSNYFALGLPQTKYRFELLTPNFIILGPNVGIEEAQYAELVVSTTTENMHVNYVDEKIKKFGLMWTFAPYDAPVIRSTDYISQTSEINGYKNVSQVFTPNPATELRIETTITNKEDFVLRLKWISSPLIVSDLPNKRYFLSIPANYANSPTETNDRLVLTQAQYDEFIANGNELTLRHGDFF